MCSHRQSPDVGGFLCLRYPALPDVLIRNNETFNWMLGKELSLELLLLSIERVLPFLLVFVCRERVDCCQLGCFGPGWKDLPGLLWDSAPRRSPRLLVPAQTWIPGGCILHFVPALSPYVKPSGAEQPSFLPLSAKSHRLLSSSGEPQAQ